MPAMNVVGGTNWIDLDDFEGLRDRWKYDFWMTDGKFAVGIRMDTFS